MQVPIRCWGPGRYWVRLPVAGDGNCFFYSLACSLNYTNYRDRSTEHQVMIGRNLRERVFNGREQQWDKFLRERGFTDMAPVFADIIPCNVYVCDFVLNFVAWLLDLRIVVLAGDERLQFGDGPACVFLAYFDNAKHFESVVCRTAEGIPIWSAEEHQILLKALEYTAHVGVGRAPNNARRVAQHAVVPCRQGFTGVFPPSFLPRS